MFKIHGLLKHGSLFNEIFPESKIQKKMIIKVTKLNDDQIFILQVQQLFAVLQVIFGNETIKFSLSMRLQ